MAAITDVENTSLLFAEQGANPATPASGFGRLYVKSDGVYFIDDAGTVTGPFGTAGGGGSGSTVSGSTTLTNTTPSSLTAVQWGTEEIVIPQASVPATSIVLAWINGYISPVTPTATAHARGHARIEASFDGGATWSTSSTQTSDTITDPNSAARDHQLALAARFTGTVTGDIQVRGTCRDGTTAGFVSFEGGGLVAMVHG